MTQSIAIARQDMIDSLLTQTNTRRALLVKAGIVGAGATAAMMIPRLTVAQDATPMAEDAPFADAIDVLNYALTLEHLENAFYELSGDFDLGEDGFNNSINDYVSQIGEHEAAHVDTLTTVISDLGGEPVERAEYDFGVDTAQAFLETAAVFENLGVSAYDGAGQFLTDPGLLTAAGTIVAVEARHAAYLNLVTGVLPFPEAFEDPLTPEEVLEAATPFFVTDDATPES